MIRSLLRHCLAAALLAAAGGTAIALPAAPVALRQVPSEVSGQVALTWTAAPGAVGYTVRRAASVTSVPVVLGVVTDTTYTDVPAAEGAISYYSVTASDGSGESPPSAGLMAGPGVIVDNGGNGTASAGSWSSTNVAGYYGTPPVYTGPAAGSNATATYTFVPELPAAGNYDVYLRWTANSNRATNAPVDLIFPDGNRTLTVDQQQNNGVWVLVSTITAETGTTASVVIRNNGANGNVVADAVQFLPRHAPWAPGADNPQDYTILPLDEPFDGDALDAATWSTFAGRSQHSVSGGRLHTRLVYKGTVPIGNATVADLENEANWGEGGIVTRDAQKFGYHEARIRLPQVPARGVDTAYWHGAYSELLNGFEIDAPEFFNKDASGVTNNYGFGVWDHVLPTPARAGLSTGRTWNYGANNSTLGDPAQYVTIGLEWRTDNTQVVYINGQKVYTAPASGMNDTDSILPSAAILSTKALDWMHPNASLDGAEATWDYARYYQKQGWTGAVDGDWSQPANWGPDGLPAGGYAAVFNVATAPAAVTLPTDQSLQSLYFDSANLPAHIFGGSGALLLGAAKSGDTSVTHGGIVVNTTVPTDQTFNTAIVGLQNLQFANLSRTPGAKLVLNGLITGSGSPRDVDFVGPMTTVPTTGTIILGQPLGGGIRHVNKAADCPFALPAGSQHAGELRIARGPVTIASVSSLGTTPDSAVVFRPRYKHSESWRPRLTYTGHGETSSHPIVLGGWQADGILENTGDGPLVWSGNVTVNPSDGNPKQVLTRDPKFTLGGNATSGENVFAGVITDVGAIVSYKNTDNSTNSGQATLDVEKAGNGTWVLAAENSYRGTTTVTGGTLVVSSFNSVNGGLPARLTSSLGIPATTENGTISLNACTLRYTGPGETTDRVLNLTGSSGATVDQSGSGLLTFSSDFKMAGTAARTLTLTGTGDGQLAGAVPNFVGTTTLSGRADAGVSILTLASVDGIAPGAVVTSASGIAPATTVTAVNPGARTITLSLPTIAAMSSGQQVVIPGVTHLTNLAKTGTGTWTLSGNSTYTGSTTVSAGTLVVDGSIAAGTALTVSAGTARLAGSGTIASPATINGSLAASPLTFAGVLSLGATGRLEAGFHSNSANGIAAASASSVTIANGAKAGVVLNGPGSKANLLASFWRTARTIPLLNASSISGNLALGNVTVDSAGNSAATYGTFSIQQTSTTVNLVWTPLPGFPVIDDPAVSVSGPSANPVSIDSGSLALRLTAVTGGGPTTTVAWTQVSGPGAATFANASSADTTVQFSTAGTYVLRVTASNVLGSAAQDVTVHVAPPASMAFRQGLNGYAHAATFIRKGSPTWNSGMRDQMLVGGGGPEAFRTLLSFDLATIPADLPVQSVTLDVWTDSGAGSGTVGALELRPLATDFVEGTGNSSSSASVGAGTGADWNTINGAASWINAGGDFGPAVLSTVPGFAGNQTSTQKTFASTSALVGALNAAVAGNATLDLIILSPTSESSGGGNYTRLSSDDNATESRRPLLTVVFANSFAPSVSPGASPPPALAGSAVSLNGTVGNATSSTWSKAGGPGSVTFGDPSSPATTAIFSQSGNYVLQLSAANAFGETSRTLPVTVLSNIEGWRQTHFGTIANSGAAADGADPDSDGQINLVEFASGTSPTASNRPPKALESSAGNLELIYPRSHAAVAGGVVFAVEWSDTLAGEWSTAGVTHEPVPGGDDGTSQLWKATVPAGSGDKRFLRIHVYSP